MYRKNLLVFGFFVLPFLVACGSAQSAAEQTSALPLETATPSLAALPTETPAPTEAPIQMPEGRLLVYTSQDYNGQYSLLAFPELSVEIYEPLNLDTAFYDRVWSLSPEGRFLAFERNAESRRLMLLDFTSGEIAILVDNRQSNGTPTWTADGRFLEFDNYNKGLTIYDTETGNARHIDVSAEFSDASAISPSGDRIAFKGGCPGLGIACPTDLYTINSDGSGEQLLETGAMDWLFWSRDSRLIYYSLFGDRETYGNSPSLEDNGYRLYAFDIVSGASQLVVDPKFNTSAVDASFLSPSGEYLVYNFGNAGLQVARTSDGSAIALLPAGYLAWSPDSRFLVTSSYEGEWNLLDVETGETIKLDLDIPAGSQVAGWLP